MLASFAATSTARAAINSPTNAFGTVGLPFSYQISSTATNTNKVYAASNLPPGIFLTNSNTGLITGIPQVVTNQTNTLVTVNGLSTPESTNVTIKINPPAKPEFSSPSTFFGMQGQPFSYPLLAVPNPSNVPTTFSNLGPLPGGAFITSNITTNSAFTNPAAQILVTNYFINASSLFASGSFAVPIVTRNAGGAATNTVTFIVVPPAPPTFTSASNAQAVVGVPFNFDVTAINNPLAIMVTNLAVGTYATNPFTGVVSTNFSAPVSTGLLQSGALTNGLYFTNINSGGSTIGRVYGTPGAAYAIRLGLFATNNVGGTNSTLTIAVGPSQPTVILSQPLGEANYVLGSSFFLNAQAFDRLPDTIVPNSVSFSAGGVPVSGTVARLGEYYGVEFYPTNAAGFPVVASAQNSLGQTVTSSPLPMAPETPQSAFPTISMLPLFPGPQIQAGGTVTLRARAFSPQTPIQRVEFYVNKVFVGSTTAVAAGTTDEYQLPWTTPTSAANYEVHARVVSVNIAAGALGPGTPPYYASSITRTPVTLSTVTGVLPSVTIFTPTDGAQLPFNVATRVVAAANVFGGSIQQVQFFVDGRPLGAADTTAPYSVDFTPTSYGTYQLFAIATSSAGLINISPTVTVTVPELIGANPTVTLDAPSTAKTGEVLTFTADANDIDGNIVSVEFLANGAPLPTPDVFGNANPDVAAPYRYSFAPSNPGRYEIVARATDNSGNVTDSAVKVLTVSVGTPPTASITAPAASPYAMKINETVEIRAAASAAAGRNVSRVEFLLNGRAPLPTSALTPSVLTKGPYRFTWRADNTGQYAVVVRVTDDLGNITDSLPITINVTQGDAPTVAITTPAATDTLTPGVPTTIVADPVGKSGSVTQVEFFVNGASVGVSAPPNAPPYVASFTPSAVGPYTLMARVTDSLGNVADSAKVTVNAANPTGAQPLISLTQPASSNMVVDSELYLNATATNADGTPLSGVGSGVTFLVNGVPVPGTADLLKPSSYSARFKVGSSALYIIQAVATNGAGNKAASGQSTITVRARPNDLPQVQVLDLLPGASTVAGGSIALRAQALFPAAAAANARVQFYANGVLLGESTTPVGSIYTFNWNVPTNLSGESVKITARAIADNFTVGGGGGGGATATVFAGSVISSNTPTVVNLTTGAVPTATITAPTGTIPVNIPANITVDASVTGTNTIASVEYYVNGVLLPPGATPPHNLNPDNKFPFIFAWTPTSPGIYTLGAIVTSSAGIAKSVSSTVTVTNGAVPTITLTSPASPSSSVNVGESVIIAASANDSDGSVVSVTFLVNGVPLPSSATGSDTTNPDTAAPFRYVFTPTSAGRYEIVARALDDRGNQKDSDPVLVNAGLPVGTVTVNFASPAPSTKFVPGSSFSALVDVTSSISAPVQSVTYYLNGVPVTSTNSVGTVIGPQISTQPFSQQVTLPNAGTYKLKAVASDIYGNAGVAERTIQCASPSSGTPPLISTVHPVPGGAGDTQNDFSTPSQFYFNAVVTAADLASIPTSSVKFFANGRAVDGTVTKVGNTFAIKWQPDAAGDYDITAQVTDTSGFTAVSQPLNFIIAPPVRPMPTLAVLPLPSSQATVGSKVYVQVTSNEGLTPISRIDFYANQVLIGSAVPQSSANTDVTTVFNWTPTLPGTYEISARAIQVLGEVGDNSLISNSRTLTVSAAIGQPPIVNVLQQPISETIYVIGSELFFNATVDPRSGATIPTTGDPVNFFFGSTLLPAEASGVKTGSLEIYSAYTEVRDGQNNALLFATARDSNNNIGSSESSSLSFVRPLYPLPTVDMLPLTPGTKPVASGNVTLRARAFFPPTANRDARVEFYANGAYVGAGTQDATDSTLYTFVWKLPSTPDSYLIEARALALNYETNVENQNVIRHFGSVISDVPEEVNTLAGNAPVVTITAPTSGSDTLVNVPLTIRADATVVGSTIAEVQFYVDGNLIFVGSVDPDTGEVTPDPANPNPDTTFPYQITFTPTQTGPQDIYAIAVGANGLRKVSDVATVNVVSGAKPTSFLTTSTSAKATALVNTNTKVVSGFTNLVGGNGYSTNAVPDVRLVGGTTNTVATVKAVVGTNGSVTGFTNLVGGSGYTNVPTVVIDPPLFQIGSAGGGTNTNGAGGTSVLLQAAAADTDGTIRQVDFLQNGVVVGTVTNAPYNFNLPLTAVGRYELIARATDNLGNVTDSPYIVINGVKGTAPTVSITTPKTGLTTPQTTLNVGWSANDTDGSVVNVQLLVNGVPEGSPVPGGSGLVPYSLQSQGKYVFVARATDNLGNVTDSQPVTVNVDNSAPQVLPVVNILPDTFSDQRYVAGSQLYLNATAIPRGKNNILSNGVAFYLLGPGAYEDASITSLKLGSDPIYVSALYTLNDSVRGVLADAEDSSGNVGSSSVYPFNSPDGGTVPPQAPLPVVDVLTNLPPSAQGIAGGVIQLQAKASFPAPAGNNSGGTNPITRVEFYADGAYLGIATPNTNPSTINSFTHFLNWTAPTNSNSFKITARAIGLNFSRTTGGGTNGATNSLNYFGSRVSPNILTVNTLTNRPPSVYITKPATNNSQVGLGVTNQIVATVSNLATNASVKEVQWYVDGLFVTNSTKFPYIYSFAPTNIGLYSLAAVVVDNFGLQGSSDVLTINAVAGSAPIVTLSAPTNGVVGGTARLVATATDVDGTIAEVDFLVNGVPAPVPALTNAPYVYNLPLNSAGRYVLEARAKDNLGNLGFSSPQTLTVSGGTTPVVSIISPTNGSTLSVGVPVTLVANASDGDGSVTSVTFRVNGTAYPATQNLGVWNAQFTPTSPGEYRVVATAVDNSGNEGISAEFIYRIPTATGLTVSMVSPADGSVYTLGTPVILNALPSVLVGTVTSVQFYVLGTPVGTPITTAPYTLAYDPPTTGNYTVYALATDSSGNVAISSSRNFSVDVAPPSGVPSIFLSAPQGTYLTRGSRAYINYTVVLPSGGDPVPAQNVQIYIDGVPVPQSEIKKIGPKGDTYSYLWTVGNSPNISVYATVVDAFGTSGFSGITTFTTAQPQRQRPVVEMLTFEAPNPFFAVGVPVTLRARANFLNNANPALEFYANGVLLGPGIPGTTSAGYTTYSYQWVPTISSPAVTITARGSGENTAIILPPPPGGGTSATIPVLASVVSGNTVTPPVTDIPIQGVPDLTSSKQLNGQFVLWMFNQLLYRNPTYPEYAQFLGLLGPESGNATASVKADMVMNLMGYNTSTTLFNAATEYAQTSAIAFAPFGRLGLTPTSSTIINFISLTEADTSPLPLAGTYGGLAGAPWRATYGYARAMQAAIFDTAAFDKLYQGASGLTGNAFVIWMTGSTTAPVSPAYMFPDRLTGGNARVDLANMIDGTPTLVSPDAADILQGAGAAFQSEYIAAALNSGLASNDPGNTEKTFQRRLQSASLAFQLGRNLQPNGTWTTDGIWNFNGAQLYSKEVVSSILVQSGYAAAVSAPPAGRTQTISFRLPTRLLVGRTYRLSATASSRLTPITFSLEGDSNSRATLNGNLLTVTQPGTVTITASQGGGTAAARRSAAPVLFEPVSATRSATAIQRTR